MSTSIFQIICHLKPHYPATKCVFGKYPGITDNELNGKQHDWTGPETSGRYAICDAIYTCF